MLRIRGMLVEVLLLVSSATEAGGAGTGAVLVAALRRRAGSPECLGQRCHCMPHGHRQKPYKAASFASLAPRAMVDGIDVEGIPSAINLLRASGASQKDDHWQSALVICGSDVVCAAPCA